MIKNFDTINKMKDIYSRECKKLVEIVGLENFPKIKNNFDLARFIEDLAEMSPTLLENSKVKQIKKLVEKKYFLK